MYYRFSPNREIPKAPTAEEYDSISLQLQDTVNEAKEEAMGNATLDELDELEDLEDEKILEAYRFVEHSLILERKEWRR